MATVEIATEDVARKSIDTVNRHDSSAFAALLAPNAEFYGPRYPEGLKGRDAIVKDIESNLLKPYPDLQFRVSNLIAKGDAAAFEAVLTGTHKGPLELPTGTVAPTNRRIEYRMAAFLRVNNAGLITELRGYGDTAAVLKQLGLGPGAGT